MKIRTSGGPVDEERLQRALTLAGLWERVQELSQKQKTLYGHENGQELSQKQKTLYGHENGQGFLLSGVEAQKAAIARALYKDAPFIIG